MRKLFTGLLLLFAALLLCCVPEPVRAEEAAENITASCKMKFSNRDQTKHTRRLTDGVYSSRWRQDKDTEGWITITCEDPEKQIGALYFQFDIIPSAWVVQVLSGDEWRGAYSGNSDFLHVWAPLDEPADSVRFLSLDKSVRAQIAEIRVYTPGGVPEDVQLWEPPVEEADILFLATHADDELIFFGGGIPTYAAELKKKVVVAYLANCGNIRSHELLDGLWSMGVRNYPVIGPFPDKHEKTMSAEYKALGGKNKLTAWVSALYRRFRPKVVVTHDVNGEYGHAEHKVCSAVAQKAYDAAMDPEVDPDSAELYGLWQVRKLYLHLAKQNRITMDWSVPLESLGGITGLEAAVRAYTYHKSQQTTDMSVTKTGKRYDNRVFGLVRTEVGPDEARNDFLEHIDTAVYQEEEILLTD